VGRKRCPSCGKRVPEEEVCCPRCGHSIPFASTGLDTGGDLRSGPSGGGGDPVFAPIDAEEDVADEGIDDPELLDRATEQVRSLPLRVVPVETPAKEPDVSAPTGWECPTCGRQAQRGWRTCPWCDSPLPARVWKRDGQDWEE
jgi:hypothetical protein